MPARANGRKLWGRAMRKGLVLVVVLAQLAVLAVMAGKRELILQRGEVVYLRTAPVDPRDPMRGDYVTLSYPLNNVSLSRLQTGVDAASLRKGDTLYALLRPAQGDVFELDSVSVRQPASGRFLRGKLHYIAGAGEGGFLRLRYGIEQLFVEQGKGLAIERRRGQRNGLQVPMEVAVALGSGGEAQLKGFRWSPLGVALEVLPPPQGEAPRSPLLKMSLRNVSELPLTIVDDAEHCSLQLQAVDALGEAFATLEERCQRAALLDTGQLITLAPGEAHTMTVDLNRPRWQLQSAQHPQRRGDMASVAGSARFRLVYRSPPVLAGMEREAASLWQGSIASPAFNARGFID